MPAPTISSGRKTTRASDEFDYDAAGTALRLRANLRHRSDPRFDTADFADGAPGNLRVDYVLPRKTMQIVDGAVFWPLNTDPLFRLVGTFPFPTSDHRLVWIDTTVPSIK